MHLPPRGARARTTSSGGPDSSYRQNARLCEPPPRSVVDVASPLSHRQVRRARAPRDRLSAPNGANRQPASGIAPQPENPRSRIVSQPPARYRWRPSALVVMADGSRKPLGKGVPKSATKVSMPVAALRAKIDEPPE